ncbi:hypothetical protein [Brumimicrobium aurantiacum]|uniref:Uncharacterized protein n=1 Tax=Brumimicrobium aurantiacum TaxID=1737063 RepID=A0A3E1F0I2_9FLAO|nr:hypothetical protein [Brumimicrobium aurantiacum]RFC55310.1 hypothetical protein DXU93_05675 [Brumimicrobium aurantiacum]
MEINLENYEAYLLDLWEGNLSKQEEAMLNDFLDLHPELKEEADLGLYSDIKFEEEAIDFDKEAIKFESINIKNYKYFFVAYFENDLTDNEKQGVLNFLNQHPQLQKEFKSFQLTKLPNEEVLFPNKEKLLLGKTQVISIQNRRWIFTAIAACIALFLWFNLFDQDIEKRYTLEQSKGINVLSIEDQILNQPPVLNTLVAVKNEGIPKSSVRKSTAIQNKKEVSEPKQINSASKIDQLPLHSESTRNNKLSTSKIPTLIASVASSKKNSYKNFEENTETKNVENKTIFDLTADYLQRKNVLDEDRKPNMKELIANTLTEVNTRKKPIILIQEKEQSKTVIFQLGGFKIERKKKK